VCIARSKLENGTCFLLVLLYDLYYFHSNSGYLPEQHWQVCLLYTEGTVRTVIYEFMCEIFVRELHAVQD
jgi:hypothetical protein